LPERWVHERARQAVQDLQVGRRRVAQKSRRAIQAEVLRALPDMFRMPALRSRMHEGDVARVGAAAKQTDSLQQAIKVFPRLDGPYGQHEPLGKSVALPNVERARI